MNQQRIWDYYQSDPTGLASFRVALPRYRFVAKRIARVGPVLNIGVGSGGLEALLLASGHDVYCVDPSARAIEALRSRLSAIGDRAHVGCSQSLPFADATFATVVMSEVLEHLDDDVLALTLGEVRRVLRPGGVFVGTVPADEDLAADVVVCPECGKPFHRWGHVQSFSAPRLQALLASRFERARVERVVFGIGEHLNWKGKAGWVIKRLGLLLGIHGSGENLFFRAYRSSATGAGRCAS